MPTIAAAAAYFRLCARTFHRAHRRFYRIFKYRNRNDCWQRFVQYSLRSRLLHSLLTANPPFDRMATFSVGCLDGRQSARAHSNLVVHTTADASFRDVAFYVLALFMLVLFFVDEKVGEARLRDSLRVACLRLDCAFRSAQSVRPLHRLLLVYARQCAC